MTATYADSVKLALVGESGAGKTHQAGYLIETFGADNVGIVNCERGLNTIATLLTADNVFNANSIEDMRKAWAWAKERYDRPDAHLFIDGGSRVMQWISNREHGGADKALEAVVTGRRNDMADSVKPFLRYITDKQVIDTQKVWIRGARDAEIFWASWLALRCNLYATFWAEKTPTGQYERSFPWTVDAPGNGMRNAIIGAFDFVFHIVRVRGEGMKVITAPDDFKYRCKRRLDPRMGIDIPDEIADFNLAKFYAALKPVAA